MGGGGGLGVSLTHPVLALFLSGEFLLQFPCWLFFFFFFKIFYLVSFSYTYRAGFIFMWEVCFTHPMLQFFFFGEFLLHISCWLLFSYLGSFSYTSRAGFFTWGVSLTHPVLASLPREFLSYIPCRFHFYLGSFFYTSRAGFILISGVSLTHPVLASFSF